MASPLDGVRVVELGGGAPAAYAGTVLAALGADVVRVDRPAARPPAAPGADPFGRARRSVAIDLKSPAGLGAALDLLQTADVAVESYRPGVCERLGLSPEVVLNRNPGLVFGRISGWGQTAPDAGRSGHDLSFLALAGALGGGADGPVTPPSYYVSSFAGGAQMLVTGVLAALVERGRTGRGQVVDASMLDGALLVSTLVEQWRQVPGNDTVVDAPFYTVYRCADGEFVAVAAIEPPLYAALLTGLGLDAGPLPDRGEREDWPRLREILAGVFASRPRPDWIRAFEGVDAGVVAVLTVDEALADPGLAARGSFVDVDGRLQPRGAARFSPVPSRVR